MDRTAYIVNLVNVYKVLIENEPDPCTGMYYHCAFDGDVHNTKEFDNVLFNMKEKFDMDKGIPQDLANYGISSGICPRCLEDRIGKK